MPYFIICQENSGVLFDEAGAHFAERDRWFRGIVTDAGMLHGYELMLP